MRSASLLLALAAAVTASPLERRQSPSELKTIVVFGDSFSDNGNIQKAFGFPVAPYFNGHFSNGRVWVEYIAEGLNINVNDTNSFVNYAYGGAVASKALLPTGARNKNSTIPPDIGEQLQWYLGNSTTTKMALPDPKTTLYPIFIGANDYLGALGAGGFPKPQQIAGAVGDFIKKLNESPLKAEQFLIMTLPDFARLPVLKNVAANANNTADVTTAIASSLSSQHNEILLQNFTTLVTSTPALKFSVLDIAALLDQAAANGFTNTTSPCLWMRPGTPAEVTLDTNRDPNVFVPCEKPDEYIFWDTIHPTTKAHAFVGKMAVDLLKKGEYVKGNSNETGGQNGQIGASNGVMKMGNEVVGMMGAVLVTAMVSFM